MTDAHTMDQAVAKIIRQKLAHLAPMPGELKNKHANPQYNILREAVLSVEQELRTLIVGDEEEVHEWLAVIHYALAEERTRLLGG